MAVPVTLSGIVLCLLLTTTQCQNYGSWNRRNGRPHHRPGGYSGSPDTGFRSSTSAPGSSSVLPDSSFSGPSGATVNPLFWQCLLYGNCHSSTPRPRDNYGDHDGNDDDGDGDHGDDNEDDDDNGGGTDGSSRALQRALHQLQKDLESGLISPEEHANARDHLLGYTSDSSTTASPTDNVILYAVGAAVGLAIVFIGFIIIACVEYKTRKFSRCYRSRYANNRVHRGALRHRTDLARPEKKPLPWVIDMPENRIGRRIPQPPAYTAAAPPSSGINAQVTEPLHPLTGAYGLPPPAYKSTASLRTCDPMSPVE